MYKNGSRFVGLRNWKASVRERKIRNNADAHSYWGRKQLNRPGGPGTGVNSVIHTYTSAGRVYLHTCMLTSSNPECQFGKAVTVLHGPIHRLSNVSALQRLL